MLRRSYLAALVGLGLVVSTVPAAEAAKPRTPTGHFEGAEVPAPDNGFDAIVFSFDVKAKKQGRKVTDFTIAMNVVCSGYPLYTQYVVQPMNDMKVKKNGSFRDVVTGATEGGTTYRVEVAGKLRGTKVEQGTMSYDVGVCQRGTGDDGPVTWAGRRTGKK